MPAFLSMVWGSKPISQCSFNIAIAAESPFNFNFLNQNLKTNTDTTVVQTILYGVHYGVKIGYDAPHMSKESDNWPSNFEHSDKVIKIIMKNIKLAHIEGPFPSPR